MDTIKIQIPGKPQYLTMVRLMTGSVAATAGFDIDAVEDIKTSMAEACKLVSCHGEEGFSDRYQITCELGEEEMGLTVVDDCGAHSLEKTAKPCLHCPAEGEIGKVVIESLMDEVQFGRNEDGQKFVKMVKRL